jgi:hypothetical protein
MKKNIKELENIDTDDLYQAVEDHANQVELNLLKIFSQEPVEEQLRVPIFDYELN